MPKHRIPLLFISAMVALVGFGPKALAEEREPHDLMGTLRSLQRSPIPEHQVIAQQIENGPRDLAAQRAAARREGIPLTAVGLPHPSPRREQDAAPLYVRLTRVLKEKPLDREAEEAASRLGTRYVYAPEAIAATRKMLAERRDVMDLVHQATDRAQCAFRRNWALGVGVR